MHQHSHDAPPPYQQIIQPSPYAPPSYGATVPPSFSAAPLPPTLGITDLRADTAIVMCPDCGHRVETVTEHKNGGAVAVAVLALLLFGCHSGGCLLPFCFPPCKDVRHSCPMCHADIATFSRLEQATHR